MNSYVIILYYNTIYAPLILKIKQENILKPNIKNYLYFTYKNVYLFFFMKIYWSKSFCYFRENKIQIYRVLKLNNNISILCIEMYFSFLIILTIKRLNKRCACVRACAYNVAFKCYGIIRV